MRWLVTTPVDADMADVRATLSDLGCDVSDDPPTPLEGNEQVIHVNGPDDLPTKLPPESTSFKGVYPDSEMELY
jgi:hypothetical protein